MTEREELVAQLVVDRALDAVVITNGNGKIVGWNHRAEEIFGWPSGDVLGATLPDTILPPDRIEPYLETIARIDAAGGGYAGERRSGLGLRRDGRIFPVEVSIAALELGGARLVSHFVRDISEQRAAEQSLHQTNELLRSLLETLPLPVNMLDAEGRVLLWKRACERAFGWTADEVLGEFVPSCTPEDVDELRARQARIFAGECLTAVPVSGLRRDGTKIELLLWVAPVYGPEGVVGSLGVLRDVTEQNCAAAELRETNALLQALLEAAPLPVTVVGVDGRVALWNPAAEREFGWTAGEVLGEAPPMIPPDWRDSWEEHRSRVLEGETITDTPVQRVRRDGSRLDVSLSVAPVRDPDGSISGSLGISMNVTERNRALDLLREGDEERRRLLAKLVRAQEEERQRIAADIHDDSVQVLTALALRLEMLRRRLDDPVALADLAEAERTARLAIGRLRHLMFELRPPGLDRDGLVAALRMHLEQVRHDLGLDFTLANRVTTEPAEETRALVYRIVQEAIHNVAKHARASRVEVTLTSRNGSIEVRVADDGRGFDPTAEQGSHLGLVFMRERAEMAGGSWRVESVPGDGTLVEFAVPAGDDREAAR